MDQSSSSLTASSFPSTDDAATAIDEAMYGCSASSSSSSIYHHPFSSFKFGPSSPNEDSPLSSKLQAMSVSPKHHYSNNSNHTQHQQSSIPPSPSPSCAESQHSMDEYEMDSPSSLSSWNSFMSGHRGDLADVEDLELGEPELATVSEIDEDGVGGNVGTTPRPLPSRTDESEEDDRTTVDGLGFGDRITRRRTINANHHGHGAHHYHHGHGHGHSGGLSHFSPRTGGHGLSHHSRWSSRTPASLAARRRKGRIAELAEEGEPGGINTTRMPSPATEATHSGASTPGSTTSSRDARSCEHSYPGTPASTQWSEFSCPPPLPIRSVSPSETVPVIPSPLCECISSALEGQEGQVATTTAATQDEDTLVTPTASRLVGSREDNADDASTGPLAAPTPRRGVFESITSNALAQQPRDSDRDRDASSSSPPDSIRTASTGAAVLASSPDTTPPSSPIQPLARQGSLRSRRSSSPVKAKVPLRPCFSRRSSATSSRNMSPDRGRCHVRFSPAPPQTIRTHSPVDYDRSSCPISNRLSVQDVEEMQKMEMEMGLLSAKCSAIAALTSCKLPPKPLRDETSSEDDPTSITRPRRESTGGLLAHRVRPGASASTSASSSSLSPAEHLRMQRELERERACRIAGIGTGLGGRNLGRGAGAQATNPLIARFGLNAPPPPLPGIRGGRGGTSLACGSASAPPTPAGTSMATLAPAPAPVRSIRASSLQRTASEERAMRRSLCGGQGDNDGDGVRGRGRSSSIRTEATTPPALSVPSVVRTEASPPTSPPSLPDVTTPSLRTPTSANTSQQTLEPDSYFVSQKKPTAASRPTASKQTSYGFPSATGGRSRGGSTRGGYDSPGSAYESGSEYDLIG